MTACDRCLRRAQLIGLLAPRIAGLLDPRRRASGLLALDDADLVRAVCGSDDRDARCFLERFDPTRARERLAELGLRATCRHGDGYPAALRDLSDPPAALFSTGPLPDGDPPVAIVGTRAPSPYGLEVATSLGRSLGAAGVVVVSGLALGVDAAAHRGCLEGGGTPVAVLAGGPETPYPRRNAALYRRVGEQGVVLSEMPPGQPAMKWAFPARNRIMAGLAAMTVLVEAADPSGSLITAEFARDLGRPVGAVPGRITSRVAAGTNALLRDGAVPVTSAEDVLDELFGAGMRKVARPDPLERLDPTHARILDAVESGRSLDAVARAAGVSAAEARAALGRLEADGHVFRSLGGYERRLR
jgi:DNA processing protein